MRSTKLAALLILVVALVTACGGPATQTEAEPTDGAAPAGTEAAGDGTATPTESTDTGTSAAEGGGCDPSAYDDVIAEVEGLDADARWDRLMELAAEEEGQFQVYATISGDEIGPLMEDFLEVTADAGIDATHYRAGSNDVLQRITQEADAGRPQADAVISTGIDASILSTEGFLQPFETPFAEDIIESTVHEDWVGAYVNVYTPAWNTDQIAEGEAPTTWEEVLAFDGPVGFEIKSYDWFGTLVTEYFMKQQGLSEDEAVELFRAASDNMVPIDGRSALTELLTAGEFPLAAGTYTQNVDSGSQAGAPISWEPPVEPLVQRPNAGAPMCGSDRPATALLFVDYLIDEPGQEMMVSFERVPTHTQIEGGLNPDYELISVDVAEMASNREKWETLYAEVTGEPAG